MTEERPPSRPPLAQPVAEANWPLRVVLVVVLLVAVGVAYFFGTTVVPRWWAQRVGARVDSSLTAGGLYGLFIGFVFTLVPLVIARQAFRKVSMGKRGLFLLVALVAAAPNLMTLSIVLGDGKAAHAGQRILDVEAPGFRAGSAWGAALAVVVAVGLFVGGWRWRRDRRQLKSLRSEKRAAQSARPAEKADGADSADGGK
jgi:hypothetical protein